MISYERCKFWKTLMSLTKRFWKRNTFDDEAIKHCYRCFMYCKYWELFETFPISLNYLTLIYIPYLTILCARVFSPAKTRCMHDHAKLTICDFSLEHLMLHERTNKMVRERQAISRDQSSTLHWQKRRTRIPFEWHWYYQEMVFE